MKEVLDWFTVEDEKEKPVYGGNCWNFPELPCLERPISAASESSESTISPASTPSPSIIGSTRVSFANNDTVYEYPLTDNERKDRLAVAKENREAELRNRQQVRQQRVLLQASQNSSAHASHHNYQSGSSTSNTQYSVEAYNQASFVSAAKEDLKVMQEKILAQKQMKETGSLTRSYSS